jgi:hypothetical protein
MDLLMRWRLVAMVRTLVRIGEAALAGPDIA